MLFYYYLCSVIINKQIEIMQNEILNIETIQATNFNVETTIVTLSECPTKEEMDFLFGNDESIILEF